MQVEIISFLPSPSYPGNFWQYVLKNNLGSCSNCNDFYSVTFFQNLPTNVIDQAFIRLLLWNSSMDDYSCFVANIKIGYSFYMRIIP